MNNRKVLYSSTSLTNIVEKSYQRPQDTLPGGMKLSESSNLSYKNQDNLSHQSYMCSPTAIEDAHKFVIQEENDELQKSENLEEIKLQPPQKREFLAIYQERINKGFSFDVEKNSKIHYSPNDDLYTYSDIFEHLTKLHKKQNLSEFIRNFKDQYIKGQNSKDEKVWHKIIYSSKSRQPFLEQCGVTTYNHEFQHVQNQKLFHLLKSVQTNRLVVMMTCLFSFENIKLYLSQVDQVIVPIIMASINLYKQYRKDQGDHDFYNNQIAQQQFTITDASKIQDYFGFKGDNLALVDLKDENLRQFNYQQLLNMIRAFCRGIQHSDPYIQLFYNFFGMENAQFQQYLIENAKIHFYDKLILTLLYCDDKTLNEFFEKTNSLDQIILFGTGQKAVDCLRKYLEKTNDIQLVGIISAHLFALGHKDQEELANWFFQYHWLLNQHQLYNERILLEQQIKEIKSEVDLISFMDNKLARTSKITHQCWCMQNAHPECLSCFTQYPKCSICFSPIKYQQFVICLKCKHGGHENHIQEWFTIYNQCPYKKCRCQCSYN